MFKLSWRFYFSVLLSALLIGGCDQSAPDPVTTDNAPSITSRRRIITLAPALTQMLTDLGLSEEIVGVAQHDVVAPPGAAVVGSFDNPDYEKLLSLKPTHVLTMNTSTIDTPKRLADLAVEGRFALASFQYPKQIWDVYNTLLLGDGEAHIIGGPHRFGNSVDNSLAVLLDVFEPAQQLSDKMGRQLTALEDVVAAGRLNQRVLMLISVDPVMAVGPDTVLDHLLFTGANAFNVAASQIVSAPTFDREKLQSLKPDVIVLLLPNDPPLKSIEEDARLRVFQGLSMPAIENNRIHLVNHPLVKLPSSTMPIVAAELAKAVHPNLADRIDAALEQAEKALEIPEQSPFDEAAVDETEGSVDDATPSNGSKG